jgi:hypothetical protein
MNWGRSIGGIGFNMALVTTFFILMKALHVYKNAIQGNYESVI